MAANHLEQCIPIILWGPGKIGKTRVPERRYLKEQTTGAQASASPPCSSKSRLELAQQRQRQLTSSCAGWLDHCGRSIKVKGRCVECKRYGASRSAAAIASSSSWRAMSSVSSPVSLIFCLNQFGALWRWPHVTPTGGLLSCLGFQRPRDARRCLLAAMRSADRMSTSPVRSTRRSFIVQSIKDVPILIEVYAKQIPTSSKYKQYYINER